MQDFPLILSDETKANEKDIEKLFQIFKSDFIDTQAVLTINLVKYVITVKPNVVCKCPFSLEKKPERFWHIITKKEYDCKKRNNPCPEDKEKNRVYSASRAKRIHWIKQTLDSIGQEHIKYFFEDNKEPTHFIWDTKRFFMVLIKHLGRSQNLLVTAYPVHKNKYSDFKSRLNRYEKKK